MTPANETAKTPAASFSRTSDRTNLSVKDTVPLITCIGRPSDVIFDLTRAQTAN